MERPVIGIVQARIGSTRLPGKVLAPVLGRPLIEFQLERLARAVSLDGVVVATPMSPADDELAEVARSAGAEVFRGSDEDVLDRYAEAAAATGAGTVVRLTADCPLIDPKVVDVLVAAFDAADGDADLVTNAPPEGRSYPDGMDVEVFSRATLERVAANALDPLDREHVTRYMHRAADLRVQAIHLSPPQGDVRISVDTAEDLALVRALFEELQPRDPAFGMADVLSILKCRGRP